MSMADRSKPRPPLAHSQSCREDEATDLSSDIAEKVCHPSGLSRRLSEVDFLTKLQLMEHSESLPEDVNLNIPVVNCIDKFTRFKALKTIGCGMDNETIDALRREKECTSVARIMVLYTGGTIGMRSTKGVYKPQANYLVKAIRKLPMFHDQAVNQLSAFASLPLESCPLVMPLSPEGVRVVYVVYEYDPLIDSSDMTMDDWMGIGRDIQREYNNYDGFVVLHGTDTLSYTSSALSFLLENLGKPVVVTGSQIPIFEVRSDGRDNFLGALIVAGQCQIPEVSVYFHNKLLRGCRVTKASTNEFDAFESPNFPAIVEFGVGMILHKDLIFKPYSTQAFCLSNNLCSNVTMLRIFPSIQVEIVKATLAPPIQGVLLQSFGAGNVPSGRYDLMVALKDAADRGVLLLNISQCSRGPVKPLYEGGARLTELGVLCGGDMTPEAGMAKLAYVLGKTEWSLEQKREALQRSLRGEISAPRRLEEMVSDDELLNRLSDALQLSSLDEARHLRNYLLPSIVCAAAKENRLDDLKRFTAVGSGCSVADYDQRTPLHLAASEGHLACVMHLLKAGAMVHVKDRFGTTPLLNAVKSRHAKVIEALRNTGGALNFSDHAIGTEIYEAASNNDIDLLRMFHLAGASLLEPNQEGRSALHAAAFHNLPDVVNFFVERLSQEEILQLLRKKDGMGMTPWQVAAQRDSEEIARMLQPDYITAGRVKS